MTEKSRKNLWTMFAALVAAYIVLVALFWHETRQYAVERTEAQVQDMLLSHRALHSYVEEMQKPEIYRLKEEGKLYPEYFSPRLLSFTFIARNVKQYLNAERRENGLPEVYFKLASTNPRNPINTADEREQELLVRMNAGELKHYRDVVTQDGRDYLYVALPVNPSGESCMRCHGEPAAAPQELRVMYGEKAGFYEKVGDIRALISIRAPLDAYLVDARRIFYGLSGATLLVLAAFFLVVWFFMGRLDRRQQEVLEANRKLESLSHTDYLTGLANRLSFSEETEREIDGAHRYGHPLGLVMLDLDHFKSINDTLGHSVGDEVLVALARLLEEQARSSDLVARWGGEEFIVLVREAGLASATAFAERVHAVLDSGPLVKDVRVTASFGVTELGIGEGLHATQVRADEALYRSKAEGRNRVTVLPAASPEAGPEVLGDVPDQPSGA